MRIAITTNTTSAGGAEKQRILLANELAAAGHEVELVVLQKFGELHGLVRSDVAVVQMNFRRLLPGRRHAIVSGTTNTELAFSAINRLFARTRVWVSAIHNPAGPGAPALKRTAQLLVRRADTRVALTERHRQMLETHLGIRAQAVIGNAVPQVDPAARDRTAATDRAGAVGFLGRLAATHKGLDRLLAALARPAARNVILRIGGSGPDLREVESMARTLRVIDRVEFLGTVTADEFLLSVEGLVLLSRWEGQPMVILEAEELGVPVLTSKEVGGAIVVDADDPDAVARQLALLAEGGLGGAPSSGRSVRDMAADYVNLLASTLENKGSRRSQRKWAAS